MKLYCDNKPRINITHNPFQHHRTKHIEVDQHFIKEKLDGGKQFADVFTKGLHKGQLDSITCKLSMKDIFKPA